MDDPFMADFEVFSVEYFTKHNILISEEFGLPFGLLVLELH